MPRSAIYGVSRGTLDLNVPLPAGTGAAEPVTDYVPGFAFTVEKVTFIPSVIGAGAGATRTLRVVKGASTVVASGTVTLAGTATIGVHSALTVTSANADFNDTDTLSVDFTAGGTAFSAGQGTLLIQYRQRPQKVS